MKMTLTITTSKRFDLFKKTIDSFLHFCQDYGIINEVYHYDDCSNYDERKEMYKTLSESFPNAKIITTYFEVNSFEDNKRHARIMRIWKDNLYNSNNQFVFHLEDDWEFLQPFLLEDTMEVFEIKNVGYVGFTQQVRTLPEKYELTRVGDYWMWIYDKDLPLQEHLFLDREEIESHPNPNYWCYFTNWPHFSLRPGVHRIDNLTDLSNFSVTDSHFEPEVALRYRERFVSFNHINKIVNHIGWEVSSYDLNQSER